MQLHRRFYLAGLLALILPVAAAGEGVPAAPDFTFKRVTVPKAGEKRVIVQIDPVEQARLLAVAPKIEPVLASANAAPDAPLPAPTARYDWFWDVVPTARGAVADRFPTAIAALSKGPEGASVAAMRMQDMQGLAEAHGRSLLAATIGTDVSPALALAVMAVESGGRTDAVSTAGAQGLMQLIPATAARFGVTDSYDAAQNIKGGVAYLDWLLDRFDNDPLMVLAAYNAGEGAVDANDGIPPYPETRDYVPKVLAAWQVAQGLCVSPPELVTDPCVFKVIAEGGSG